MKKSLTVSLSLLFSALVLSAIVSAGPIGGGGGGGGEAGTASDVTCTNCVTLGTETAGNYAGSSTEGGAATTALALDANPSDCSANQFANTIAANGNLTCAAIGDADVPDTLTASNYLPLAGGLLTGLLELDNLGLSFPPSDTNPACGAGEQRIFADLSENKLKKCENGVVTDLDTASTADSFSTWNVPVGTDPVADSAADTVNITETSPLTITGDSGTDTINITWNTLTVAEGGTGAASLTDGGVLYGAGTSAIANSGVLADGTIIVGDGATAPTTVALLSSAAGTLNAARFPALTGDVTTSAGALATTIAADAVALTADTTGNYVTSVATTAPVTGGAAGSEGATLTIGLTQHAGTDITADLEEETHASEHNPGGADELAFVSNLQDEGADLTARRKVNLIGTGVACVDNAGSSRTDCTIDVQGEISNSFTSWDVPAGTDPAADSTTDTFTITETSPLVITGDSGTDTVNITWTTLTVAEGGTGATSLTDGGVLYGAGTGAIANTGVLADGTIVVGDGVTAPTTVSLLSSATGTINAARFPALTGDVTTSAGALATTIAANAVALTTDTTGNYVATVADAGNNTITVSGSGSEGGAVTLDVVDLNCTNCIGATEVADLTLGSHTTGNYVANAATDPLTGLTGGSAGSEGAALALAWDYTATLAANPALAASACVPSTTGFICEGATANTSETLLTVADPDTDRTITFPNETGTVITSGTTVGGDLTGSYPSPTIAANAVALGTDTTGNYAGSSSEGGAATTALALDANPSDCSANQFATTIAASGNLTCAAIVDADIPDTVTASNYLPLAGGTMTGQLETDNLGIEFIESDVNPGCGAGNFSIYSDTSDAKLKKCENGVVTDLDASGSGAATSFVTWNVPAGTDPVSDDPADTFTLTETSPLVITGDETTDTVNITWTTLTVAEGGTGATSLTDGGVLIGAGTGAVTNTGVIADGSVIVGDGVTAPTTVALLSSATGTLTAARFPALTGDVTTSAGALATTIAADSVALGTDTTGNYAGSASEGGAATTALALDANPSDCSANQFANAIAASGNLTCAGIADADVPNTITVDLAASATALAANGGNCSAGQAAGGVDTAGAAESCIDPILDSDVSAGEGFLRKTGAGTYTAHKSNLGASTAPTVDSDTTEGYTVGSVWIDTTADISYVALDVTDGAAVWTQDSNTANPGLQAEYDASGANPEIDVGANGLVISDLTSTTKALDICNADESQCWILYVDGSDGPIMTTKVAVDPITKIPNTLDYRLKDSDGADLLAVDEATMAFTFNTAASLALPNGAAPTVDAFAEIAGDNNLWAASRGAPIFYDGTAATALVNVLVSDAPSNGQVPTWNTGGTITWETPSAGATTKVTTLPMRLSSITVGSNNAVVNTVDGTNFDYSGIRYADNAVGTVTYTVQIPSDLAATPAWELAITHKSLGAETSDLVAVLDVTCNAVADDEDWDAAGTALEADLAVTCDADGGGPNLTKTTLDTTGDYDSEEALAAGDTLVCVITRDGDNAPDTLSADWLLLDVSVRITVNS